MCVSRFRAFSPGALWIAALAGGLLLSPAVRASAAPPPHTLRILAPGNGAVLPAGKALVIGRTDEPGIRSVEIDVNGKVRVNATLARGGFQATVYLIPGKNILTVRAADTVATAAVLAADSSDYRYHPEVGKCADCHPESRKDYRVPRPHDAACYRCHERKDKRKFVHGPLGSGDCTSCHDPHGSSFPSLTTARIEVLCTTCHDQKSSERHLKQSRGKGCASCHDPHSADRNFLRK